MKNDLKKGIEYFLYFFRIGWFTFGGGWNIVAQLDRDYVENRKELSHEELLDIVSVGRSLPGTMVGNVAYLFGYRTAGVVGGVLSVCGMILPPFLILTVLTFCYTNFKDNVYVAKALVGVRACVVPVIGSAVLKLVKGAFPLWESYLLCLVTATLSAGFGVSCILLVLLGCAVGLVIGGKKKC